MFNRKSQAFDDLESSDQRSHLFQPYIGPYYITLDVTVRLSASEPHNLRIYGIDVQYCIHDSPSQIPLKFDH